MDGTFKKKRKKVNFNIDINKNDGNDFSPPQVQSPIKKQQIPSSDYEELITENDHLRQIIREMEEALQFANVYFSLKNFLIKFYRKQPSQSL